MAVMQSRPSWWGDWLSPVSVTEQLDVLEIEEGMVELVAEYFDGEWLEDPRVQVIVEDGRNYHTWFRRST